jgi:hypothetical protein
VLNYSDHPQTSGGGDGSNDHSGDLIDSVDRQSPLTIDTAPRRGTDAPASSDLLGVNDVVVAFQLVGAPGSAYSPAAPAICQALMGRYLAGGSIPETTECRGEAGVSRDESEDRPTRHRSRPDRVDSPTDREHARHHLFDHAVPMAPNCDGTTPDG